MHFDFVLAFYAVLFLHGFCVWIYVFLLFGSVCLCGFVYCCLSRKNKNKKTNQNKTVLKTGFRAQGSGNNEAGMIQV